MLQHIVVLMERAVDRLELSAALAELLAHRPQDVMLWSDPATWDTLTSGERLRLELIGLVEPVAGDFAQRITLERRYEPGPTVKLAVAQGLAARFGCTVLLRSDSAKDWWAWIADPAPLPYVATDIEAVLVRGVGDAQRVRLDDDALQPRGNVPVAYKIATYLEKLTGH